MEARAIITRLLVSAVPLTLATGAFAQSDPGSLERTVPKFDVHPVEKQPRVASPVAPKQESARVAGRFVLSAVNVEGATIFTSAQLAESFEPYLASEVGQAELEKIADTITARYRRAGYVLSYAFVPEQSVQSGIVRIRVVEGFVGGVGLEGDRRSAIAVRKLFERLSADRPLRSSTLERVLGLAKDMPGVVLGDVRISRLPADPGSHQLTVAMGADRYRGLFYTDNRGTAQGARLRGYSSLSASSLVVPGDQFQVDLFTIPSKDFRYVYGQAKASLPLTSDGLRMTVSGARGDGFQRVAGRDQDGRSRQLVADLSYPLLRNRSTSLTGHVALSDWKSREELDGLGLQRDRIQTIRASLDFARASTTQLTGRIAVSRGVDLGAVTERGDPLTSRPFGRAKFTKVTADLQIARPLSDRVNLRIDTSAQLSFDPLLAAEEFALGGSRIGRAFDFNDVTGDEGFGGMAELAYRVGDVASGIKALELFTFADAGGAFRKRPSAGLPDDEWLAGVGAGSRFSLFGMLISGEVGVPVARSNSSRNVRAFVSLAKAL